MKEIMRTTTPSITAVVTDIIEPTLKDAHAQMISEFETHQVTQEVDAGENSTNISGTLSGYGNLFSFLGFESSSQPLSTIRDILKQPLKITQVRKNDRGKLTVFIKTPSKEEILSQTPMPWDDGRSWVDGIEHGVAGFGYYLYKPAGDPNSRSGVGLQSSGNLRGGKMSNTPYISRILENLRKNIKK